MTSESTGPGQRRVSEVPKSRCASHWHGVLAAAAQDSGTDYESGVRGPARGRGRAVTVAAPSAAAAPAVTVAARRGPVMVVPGPPAARATVATES